MPDTTEKVSKYPKYPAGQPTKYDSEIHDKSIEEILRDGQFVESFCVLHDVTEVTFYNWCKTQPTFKAATDKGRLAGKVLWLEKPLKPQEKSFNYQYWHIIMRNCFGFDKPPVIPNDGAETPTEFLQKIIDLYCKGKITDVQFDRLVMGAESRVKMKMSEDIEKRLEIVEARYKKK